MNEHAIGLEPQYDFYDVFKVVEKQTDLLFGDLEVFPENSIYDIILKNIENLREGIWYKVYSKEKKEAFKELIREGFLPDVVFNDEFTKVKRQDTELVMNLVLGNGISKTKRFNKIENSKKVV